MVRETPLEAVLTPGDALYFPKDWAHHTEALTHEAVPSAVRAPPAHQGADAGAGRGSGSSAAATHGTSFSLGFRTDGQYLM